MKKIFGFLSLLFILTLSACSLSLDFGNKHTEEDKTKDVDIVESEEENNQTEEDNVTYATTEDVRSGVIGKTYNLKVVVSNKTDSGYLVEDKTGYLFVYLRPATNVKVGDEVIVKGISKNYGGKVQLSEATLEKTNKTKPVSFNPEFLTGEDLNTLLNTSFEVGFNVTLTGTVVLDGKYTDLEVLGFSKTISISGYNLTELRSAVGKKVQFNGYLLYQSHPTVLNVALRNFKILDNGGTPDPDVPTDTTTLSIIEFNDVHGFIEQDEYHRYGLSNLAYLVNKEREKVGRDNVVLIGNGDMFQGTALVRMSYGRVLIDAMNAMGFDATCLGNHEFDWDLPMILEYFDGQQENGEANFPLLNANVKQDGKLVTIDGGKVFESTILNKGDLKVGVIGYIGDVKSSINALYAAKYEFDVNFERSLTRIGSSLKDQGADIIVVSVHDSADNIASYTFNQIAAHVKYNDEYLIDAVICGHTHMHQHAYLTRANGAAMPVIQSKPYTADGYINEAGKIDLIIDTKTKKVVNSKISFLNVKQSDSFAEQNYDKDVQNVIDCYYNESKAILEERYCYTGSYIDRFADETKEWVANVMVSTTGADVAICNNGGLRSSINAGYITFNDMYAMNPFDNHIIMHEVEASLVNNFISDTSHYFSAFGRSGRKESGYYLVAVIDYVYYGKYYGRLRTSNNEDTNLVLRDMLIGDLRLRDNFDINFDNLAKIKQQYFFRRRLS